MTGPSPTPASGPPPRYLAGRYRLDRVLGKGAMGKVWAAHDEALNRWVAIKEVDLPRGMPASEIEQAAERTMREARAVASVSDPHVVTIYDLLTIGHAPAIVMELLDARSLAEILRQDGPVGDSAAATIGLAVAAGLAAAHAAGVTHRDVKPGNVLLCRDGRVKLTDFGIARSMGEHTLTATGLLLGSPAYIAPEVAAGNPATATADAWGLGALLYACVEGVPPFDRGDPFRTLTAVVQDPVPDHPAAGRLSRIIQGLLVKDPAARMTVTQAHHVLRHLDDDPTGRRLAAYVDRPLGAAAQARRSPAPPGAAAAAVPPRSTTTADGVRSPAVVGGATGFLRMAGGAPPSPALPPPPWAATGAAALPALPAPELPPPPWAGTGAAALPALPNRPTDGRDRPGRARIWLIALLIATVAAAAGYLGVRAIAALARSTATTGQQQVAVPQRIGPGHLTARVLVADPVPAPAPAAHPSPAAWPALGR